MGLIAYASLYPFAFDLGGLDNALHGPWLTRMAQSRFVPLDAVANLFFYIPLGFVLMLRAPLPGRNLGRAVIATFIGLMVSIILEILQFAVPSRISSLLDVALNTLSTSAGALIALWYGQMIRRLPLLSWLRHSRIDAVLAILLFVWLSLHAAPFIPRLGLSRAWLSLELVREWNWSVSGSARWFASYLLLATALRVLITRERFWLTLWVCIAASLLAQIVFSLHRLEADEIIGALIAIPLVAVFRLFKTARTLRAVWWLTVGGYALSALAPFDFVATRHAFHWLPFIGILESNLQNGFFSLAGKVFVYLGLLWVATQAGSMLGRASVTLFALALALELTQEFLPGRVAESTDPVLVLLAATVLAMTVRPNRAVLAPQPRPY